jgi:hypothetical protein
MKHLSPVAAALMLALAACTGPGTSPTPSPSPSAAVSPTASATPHNTNEAETEACEHLKEGPAAPTSATLTAEGAPEVKADHKRYDITLLPGTGGNRGTVRFNSAESAEWSFFTDKDIPVVVRDASGTSLPILEQSKRSTFCLEVKAHNVFKLDVGPYTAEFGPTTETTVGLVVEETHPAEGEHQD